MSRLNEMYRLKNLKELLSGDGAPPLDKQQLSNSPKSTKRYRSELGNYE